MGKCISHRPPTVARVWWPFHAFIFVAIPLRLVTLGLRIHAYSMYPSILFPSLLCSLLTKQGWWLIQLFQLAHPTILEIRCIDGLPGPSLVRYSSYNTNHCSGIRTRVGVGLSLFCFLSDIICLHSPFPSPISPPRCATSSVFYFLSSLSHTISPRADASHMTCIFSVLPLGCFVSCCCRFLAPLEPASSPFSFPVLLFLDVDVYGKYCSLQRLYLYISYHSYYYWYSTCCISHAVQMILHMVVHICMRFMLAVSGRLQNLQTSRTTKFSLKLST